MLYHAYFPVNLFRLGLGERIGKRKRSMLYYSTMKLEINFNPFHPTGWERFMNWFFGNNDIRCQNIVYNTRKEYEEDFYKAFHKLVNDGMIEVIK